MILSQYDYGKLCHAHHARGRLLVLHSRQGNKASLGLFVVWWLGEFLQLLSKKRRRGYKQHHLKGSYVFNPSVPRAFQEFYVHWSMSQASPGPPQVQRILRHLVQCLCLLCLASHNANAKFQRQKTKSQSVMFAFTAITRYQVQLGSRLAIQQGTVRGGCVRWDFLCAL